MLWPKTSVTKIRYGSRKCGTRTIAVKLGNLLSASRRRRRVQLAPLWPHSSKPLLLVPFSAMESVLTKEWNGDLSSNRETERTNDDTITNCSHGKMSGGLRKSSGGTSKYYSRSAARLGWAGDSRRMR